MVTPNKALQTPPNNSDVGTWDQPVNANSQQIDLAFGGVVVLNAQSASGTVVLTQAQYTPPMIVVSGTPAAAVNYQLPAGVGGFYFVYNNVPASAPAVSFSSGSPGASGSVIVPPQAATPIVIDANFGARLAVTPVSPAGANGQIQFNSNGAFGANANINTDGTNFSVGGAVYAYNGIIAPYIEPTAGSQAAVIPVYGGIATPGHDFGYLGAGTLTVDCRISNCFKVEMGGNMSLALANPGDMQTINLFLQQDATGNRTMSWPGGSSFYLSGGVTTLSTPAYSIDLLVATYVGAWGVWMGSLIKGFVPQ